MTGPGAPPPADTDALLVRLAAHDIRLSLADGRLRYDAPAGALTPELRAALRHHRAALLRRLATRTPVRSAPATAQQDRYLRTHARMRRPEVLNVAFATTLTGPLDLAALRGALALLLRRHEGLRTTFRRADGAWWQDVHAPRPFALAEEDTRGRPGAAARIADAEAAEPFDPAAGTGPRLRLLRTGHREWDLLLALHHSACDAWCYSLLLRELAALYGELATGTPAALPHPVPQPVDVALRERAAPPAGSTEHAYGADILRGLRAGHGLPVDAPRPARLSGRGRTELFTVPAPVRAAVEALAARHGTTAFAVCVTVFGALLCRRSGRADTVVVVPYANRDRADLEALAACTAMPFPLRLTDPGHAPGALGDAARRTGLAAMRAVGVLPPARALLRHPGPGGMLPTSFHFQSALDLAPRFPGLGVRVRPLVTDATRDELAVGLIPTGGTWSGYTEFSTDLWRAATIRALVADYVALLASATGTDTGSAQPAGVLTYGRTPAGW